jgi:ATP-binding cassette subfamily F protein uup
VREVGDRVALADGSSVEAERVLERLGFERDHHEKPLSKLSGGELKRARFARLLLEAPNFLALDEPTNDLDIDTIGMMEDFLLSSGACLLVVSHDRAFLSRVTGRIFALDGSGAIRDLPGGYAEYLDLREAARIAQGSEAEGASEAQAAPEGEPEGRKKLSFAERREFERVEARVAELEAEIASLETAFQSGDGAEVERASRRYDEARTELETAIARWETLAERA